MYGIQELDGGARPLLYGLLLSMAQIICTRPIDANMDLLHNVDIFQIVVTHISENISVCRKISPPQLCISPQCYS